MKRESANTPLILQAVQLYRQTFGLIPPVFADIVISSQKSITVKYYYKHENPVSHLLFYWALFIVFALFCEIILIFTVVAKKVCYPTTTYLHVLETAIFLAFIAGGLFLLSLLVLIHKYKKLLPLVNDFIENGCHLGKSNKTFKLACLKHYKKACYN